MGQAARAHHCDWELAKISELQTILIGPEAAPGQATTCSAAPYIDPGFAAIGGPTNWSAFTNADFPLFAWNATFGNGTIDDTAKRFDLFVRAGSCH